MKNLTIASVLLIAATASAYGDLLYHFAFEPQIVVAGSLMPPFSFDVTSPAFITEGPLVVTPFTISGGSSVSTITDGLACQLSLGAIQFFFVSKTDAYVLPGCGGGTTGPAGGYVTAIFRPTPMSNGTYTAPPPDTNTAVFGPVNNRGVMTLTITGAQSVPEPMTSLLWVGGAALIVVLRNRRMLA